MKTHLPIESLERIIQLLKFSDWSYRAIATDVGCSPAFVCNMAQGDVPLWFFDHLARHSRELLNMSLVCHHCRRSVPMWALDRGNRVVSRLSIALYLHERRTKAARTAEHEADAPAALTG